MDVVAILALVAASVLFLLVYAATQWLALTLREWVRERRSEAYQALQEITHDDTGEPKPLLVDRLQAFFGESWPLQVLGAALLATIAAAINGWGFLPWIYTFLWGLVILLLYHIGEFLWEAYHREG